MELPRLAPRPKWLDAAAREEPQPVRTYFESDWAAMRPEIERLYIRERRKLRYVMQCMERQHGFKASEQMYKKRFAKWGFQKNVRCSTVDPRTLKTQAGFWRAASRQPVLKGDPGLGHYDSLTLLFLSNVRAWSLTFFESVQSCKKPLVFNEQRSARNKETSFAFKLAMDLLNRGHGNLAGRLVRRAFLLVEDIVTLEGPVLIWNLLETMYSIVTVRHVQLFQQLLAHIIALADNQMSATHPLPAMLRGLKGFTESLSGTSPSSSISKSHSASPSSPPFTTSSHGTAMSPDPVIPYGSLSSLLERAWVLNAELLFDHFDPRLLELYYSALWESCAIDPPAAIFRTARQWFDRIEEYQRSSAAADAYRAFEDRSVGAYIEDGSEILARRLLAPRTDASPPQSFEMLRTSNIAALREQRDTIFSQSVNFKGSTTTLLPMFASLIKAQVLEGPPGSSTNAIKEPHLHAGNLACMIKTLMDLKPGGNDIGEVAICSDAVERMRTVVALRESAQGELDPQVIQELWLLEDALIKAGDYDGASTVNRDAFCRLESYLQNIPANYV